MHRLTLLPLLLLSSPLALASDECPHAAPRQLQLDTAGARTVRVEVNQHTVHLRAAGGDSHGLSGRACAGKPGWLDALTVTQERQGDTLVVRLRREQPAGMGSLFGNDRASLELSGTVPDDVLVQLVVGSGDGFLEGAARASVDVGSGDARVGGVRGAVTAKVGSGDIEVDGAGALKVLAIGSGDLEARDIAGDVDVGSIGSGDLEVTGVRGNLAIGSIGSGDARLKRIDGTVTVETIGSGDLELQGATALQVRSIGSGKARHRDVGQVDLPARD